MMFVIWFIHPYASLALRYAPLRFATGPLEGASQGPSESAMHLKIKKVPGSVLEGVLTFAAMLFPNPA